MKTVIALLGGVLSLGADAETGEKPAQPLGWISPLHADGVLHERRAEHLRSSPFVMTREDPPMNRSLASLIRWMAIETLGTAYSSNTCGDETATVGRGPHEHRRQPPGACDSHWRPH